MIEWIKAVLFWIKSRFTKGQYKNKKIISRDVPMDQLKLYKTENAKFMSPKGIDITTWDDLELDDVFKKMNRTVTSLGEEKVVSWMVNPTHNEALFEKRMSKIDLANNAFDNSKMREELSEIGYLDFFSLNLYEISQEEKKISKRKIFFFIPTLILLTLILWLNVNLFMPIITISFIVLMLILHYSYSITNKHKILSYIYLIKVTNFYLGNKNLMDNLYHKDDKFDKVLHTLISTKRALLRTEGFDYFADFREIITLNLIRKTKKIDRIIYNEFNTVKALFNRVGELDAIQSIHTFKEELNLICKPQLSDSDSSLTASNLKNFLVADSIGNDICLNKGVIITGSNMSGKSTFLRTIGINALFSQAFGFAFASYYKSGFLTLVTSISLKDQIRSGKSYFMMEAEAIKRMLDSNSKQHNCLFLIDEIFKGTNPTERLAASVEVLNDLNSNKNMVVATTHDLEILSKLENYNTYYFDHNVLKKKLVYDYKLKIGISSHKNAVKLMDSIGFPRGLIDRVYARMENKD